MRTMAYRALARRAQGGERLVLAILCILGVLAWALTMSAMSHGQLDAGNALSHAHSAPTSLTASGAGIDQIPDQAGVSVIGSSTTTGIDLACAILGTGCLLALIVLTIRMILSPPSRSWPRPVWAPAVRVLPIRAHSVPRPSLTALSISRT